jgi:hypothetical protein
MAGRETSWTGRRILQIRLASNAAGALILLGIAALTLAELAFGTAAAASLADMATFRLAFVSLAATFLASPVLTLFMMLRPRHWRHLAREAGLQGVRLGTTATLAAVVLYLAAWTHAGGHLDPACLGVLGIALLFLPLYALDCRSRWRALRHG